MNTFESLVFATSVSLLVVVFCNVLSAATRPKKENGNVANFRAYSGLYIKIEKDVPADHNTRELKAGQILQIMCVYHGGLSFVGINGFYAIHKLPITPLYSYDPSKKS